MVRNLGQIKLKTKEDKMIEKYYNRSTKQS